MKTPKQAVEDVFLGKKIKSFGFGAKRQERINAIGKTITLIDFCVDENGDGAVLFYMDGTLANPVLVYDCERVEFEG